MKLDFTYFEYKDLDGIWKTHPIESVKHIGTIPDDDFYPPWKHGLCLAIAYYEDGELTTKLFKHLWDGVADYFQLRIVSAEGMRIPINCAEGNGPHYNWKTHCLFGYLSPSFFSADVSRADTVECQSMSINAQSVTTSLTNLSNYPIATNL